MTKRKWEIKNLEDAVRKSISIANVLRLLGLKPRGSNYITIKKEIRNLGLDTSHFLGFAHLKGRKKSSVYKTMTKDLLVENSDAGSSCIKNRILKEKLIHYSCKECGLIDWLGKPIVLHLDHINGNNRDHRIENLRFLCPNCHSNTDTYCGKKNKHN
jgi:hypothetical protein